MALQIAALVIVMSAGVTWVHCEHSGRTRMVMPTQSLSDCAQPMTGKCMQYTMQKLSPTVTAPAPILLHAMAVVMALPQPQIEVPQPRLVSSNVQNPATWLWQGPPKEWLHIIRVLLI